MANSLPKKRKVTSGPIREKARTMEKLIKSVGKVLKKQGYPGLTVAKIAAESKLDRKLVYAYFGTLDNLIEAYITGRDYWKGKAQNHIQALLHQDKISNEEMIDLLNGQFNAVLNDQTLQRILQWEISEPTIALKKTAADRELIGEELIKKLEQNINTDDLDIRAILAIQSAGLYYLALHAKANGSTFCGIDVNQEMGKQRIENALAKLLNFKRIQ